MKICFIDEAGDLGPLAEPPQPNDQPVPIIGGLFVDAADLVAFTSDFLALKYRYFSNPPYPWSRPPDRIPPELRGSEIRPRSASAQNP